MHDIHVEFGKEFFDSSAKSNIFAKLNTILFFRVLVLSCKLTLGFLLHRYIVLIVFFSSSAFRLKGRWIALVLCWYNFYDDCVSLFVHGCRCKLGVCIETFMPSVFVILVKGADGLCIFTSISTECLQEEWFKTNYVLSWLYVVACWCEGPFAHVYVPHV